MSDERALYALKALADEDRGREAPEEVERRVVAKFHARKRRKAAGWILAGMVAAAAVVIAMVAFERRSPAPAVQKQVENVSETPPVVTPVIASEPAREIPQAPPVRRPAVVARRAQPEEVVTEFFPLMNPAPPLGSGQILRVQLPASAMQVVGLPVREDRLNDRVQADVIVGEEGLARAIRFVSYEFK